MGISWAFYSSPCWCYCSFLSAIKIIFLQVLTCNVFLLALVIWLSKEICNVIFYRQFTFCFSPHTIQHTHIFVILFDFIIEFHPQSFTLWHACLLLFTLFLTYVQVRSEAYVCSYRKSNIEIKYLLNYTL